MPDIFVNPEEEKKTEVEVPSEIKKEPKSRRHKIFGHSHRPLSSFCYYPDKADFETKEKDEEVILLLRQHPVVLVPKLLVLVLLILAPAVLGAFPLLSFLPGKFQVLAILGWYLITTAFALEAILTWYFNVYILTDERIIDIDFFNLIYKEVSDANIDKVQDVTYKMGGVTRTLFNFGDVLIQTASEVPNFEFLAVPKPNEVAKVLQDLRLEEEQEKLEGRIR